MSELFDIAQATFEDHKKNKNTGTPLKKKQLASIAPKPTMSNSSHVFCNPIIQTMGKPVTMNSYDNLPTPILMHDGTMEKAYQIKQSVNQTKLPTAIDSRLPCPVQLSAAIALSELAAKKEAEPSKVTGDDDVDVPSHVLANSIVQSLGHTNETAIDENDPCYAPRR